MSVAFESNSIDSNRIKSQGFSHRMRIYNMSDSSRFAGGNPWSSRLPAVKEEENSSSSSSIGKNSDVDGGGGSEEDDDEVQSKDNRPLNDLNALEEALPIKRGISTFYAGKSKSYGSLADASSVPSIDDIVKPEDAYSRKRKNILAHNVLLDNHRKPTSESGISKKFAKSTTIGLASALNINSDGRDEDGGSSNSNSNSNSNSSLPDRSLPPLPRKVFRLPTNESSDSSPRLYSSPWRSLSLSDLQHATGSMSNKRDTDEH